MPSQLLGMLPVPTRIRISQNGPAAMRLATAFVDIVARTEIFREQLEEVRQMATSAADEIRKTFETPSPSASDRILGRANGSPSDDRILGGRPESRAAGVSSDSSADRSNLSVAEEERFSLTPSHAGPLVLPASN